MKRVFWLIGLCLNVMAPGVLAEDAVSRGRYLVAIGGCNDCHTDGFAQLEGKVPEAQHLLGSAVGFSGPWGVSYADNLRLYTQAITREQWLQRLSTGGLPPMPWPSLWAMTEQDKLAIYDYILSLGAAGREAPQALPPGTPIATPHIVFVPQAPAAGG